MPTTQHPKAYAVLVASTFAFMVCFAVWMMFGVIGIPIREALQLSNAEFGLLTATPVLLGAVMRLPLGIWTDRLGGRTVMTVLLLVAAAPVYLVSYATQYWQLLAIGLALGVVGASFAVGTPYCARFFAPEKRGFAMGFFGAGTIGAALNMFVAPRLFGRVEIGVLPRLVHSRFGLHVVEVLAREPGVAQPFESVRGAVIGALRQQAFVTALRQYLQLLAGEATVEGVELAAAATPLVQ